MSLFWMLSILKPCQSNNVDSSATSFFTKVSVEKLDVSGAWPKMSNKESMETEHINAICWHKEVITVCNCRSL